MRSGKIGGERFRTVGHNPMESHPSIAASRIITPSRSDASSPADGASRSPTTDNQAAPMRWSPHRRPRLATGTGRAPAACTSTENADSSDAARQFVRVTHPFHPLFGRQLPCVGKRYNRYGERLLLRVGGATVWSVPPQWTDLASPDPEVVMGHGRALLRAVDLMELASLVKRLSERGSLRSCRRT